MTFRVDLLSKIVQVFFGGLRSCNMNASHYVLILSFYQNFQQFAKQSYLSYQG
jgi:hypothetical protein